MFDFNSYAMLVSKGNPLRQMQLLNAGGLRAFTANRSRFSETHIELLWQIGLLRADRVLSTELLEQQGLIRIDNNDGQFVYADLRPVSYRPEGWTTTLSDRIPWPNNIHLLFHPFRFFVLYHLKRTFDLKITPVQILSADRYPRMVERQVESFRTWSASEEFSERLTYWNNLATLVIVTEPCVYEIVFNRFSRPTDIEENVFRASLDDYRQRLGELYRSLDVKEIDQFRRDLCIDAEILDDNPKVHTLLRLASGEERLKLRGNLGGAMLMKTMAEMIRRAAEHFYKINLPEEDELGFRFWPEGAKERLYGSRRIFDGDRNVSLQVVRQLLLDYSTRLRWYVEGATEYGAIQSIVRQFPAGIEIVNLSGQVIERGRRGLAFRENLREDCRTSVFSFITLDGDSEDNIRLVSRSAQDDDFCGNFFIHNPDFEFANFTLGELEEIIWSIAEGNGSQPKNHETLRLAISNASSGEELIRVAKNCLPELAQLSKGDDWGERLGEYAWINQNLPNGTTRPIVEQVRRALRSDFYDFQLTRRIYRVDPNTGDLLERN